MKVLLVSPNFFPKAGGIESHLIELIRNVRDVRFDVLTEWRPGASRAQAMFPHVGFHFVWPSEKPLRKWFARSRLTVGPYRVMNAGLEILRLLNRRNWLRRLDADIVHVHYLGMDQADRIAKRSGMTNLIADWYQAMVQPARGKAGILFTDHTVFAADPEVVPREAKDAMLGAFPNIISVDVRSFEVVESYQKTRSGRCWLIPNSVDTTIFRRRPSPRSEFRVGFAGRIGKSGEKLLEAVVGELGTETEWSFALAGEAFDIQRTRLGRNTRSAKLQANIDYLDMPDFYSSIDLLFNPYPGEGIGRTTLEAMSCGVPVIGVGIGPKYPIQDGETGYLLPPDAAIIADRIRDLRRDQGALSSMGARARAIVENEFSSAVVLPKVRAVYDIVSEGV